MAVLPGSHRGEFGDAVAAYFAALDADAPVASLSGFATDTEHGDVIAFDELSFTLAAGAICDASGEWTTFAIQPPGEVPPESIECAHACRCESLRGCIVVPLDEPSADAAGRLLGAARAADIVDASVVTLAVSHRARILTGDPDDIEGLVAACGIRLSVVVI